MAGFQISPAVKKNWEEMQKRHSYPVNALGVKIETTDDKTLKVWRELGIDKFLKR